MEFAHGTAAHYIVRKERERREKRKRQDNAIGIVLIVIAAGLFGALVGVVAIKHEQLQAAKAERLNLSYFLSDVR